MRGICNAKGMLPAYILGLFCTMLFADGQSQIAEDETLGVISKDMTREERDALLIQLYTRGVEPTKSWQDVVRNDRLRGNNYGHHVSDKDEWVRNRPLYCAIPRPEAENETLVKSLRDGLEAARQGDCKDFVAMLSEVSFSEFCSLDARLCQIGIDLLSSTKYPLVCEDRYYAMYCATRFLGTIHVKDSIEFLSKARKTEFWEKLPALRQLEEKERVHHTRFLVEYSVEGIERLPLDTAILLLEEMYGWLTPEDELYRKVLDTLDRLWQRKKGEYHSRLEPAVSVYGSSIGVDPYPNWLFGPGGKRIEKPFGEDVRVDEFDKSIEAQVEKGNIDPSVRGIVRPYWEDYSLMPENERR